jgi:threonine/homoserine/homoserine lactone efflux protein
MTYAENLWLYLALLFGIIIVPGMDSLFVMANSLTGGRRLGLAAVFGIMLGGMYHTIFGAVGVSILLKLAPALLTVLLIAGAAYMAWIGCTLLKSSITVNAVGTATTRTWATAFRQGAITCMLNPKAYLFTVSVYPQFIKPLYGPILGQALVMGVMTALMQLGIYGSLALAAGKSRDLLIANPRATMLIGRLVGLVFIIAAGITAWEGLRA